MFCVALITVRKLTIFLLTTFGSDVRSFVTVVTPLVDVLHVAQSAAGQTS